MEDRHRVDDSAPVEPEAQPAVAEFTFEQRDIEAGDVETGEIRALEHIDQAAGD